MKLTEAQRAQALYRVCKEPQRLKDGCICIGGISGHEECYGHEPGLDCPYCILSQLSEAKYDIRRQKRQWVVELGADSEVERYLDKPEPE